MNWVDHELGNAPLGDQRLTRRAKILLESMISQPSASLPVACRGWDETQAAYRFFDNANVAEETILASHQDATKIRMADHDVVLCLQD